MVATLTLNTSMNTYAAFKDLLDMLSFVHQSLEHSDAINNGKALELSPQAVAGCATLLHCIITGLEQIADSGGCTCDCQHQEGK